jgi:hypothetical protein
MTRLFDWVGVKGLNLHYFCSIVIWGISPTAVFALYVAIAALYIETRFMPTLTGFLKKSKKSTSLRTVFVDVIVIRPPKRRQVPAEVQFEVARNAVADTTDFGTARLRAG